MDQPGQPKPRIVACPSCGGDSVYATTNPYRPFCSERCKIIDLGGWLEERNAIPGEPAEIPDDDSPKH